MTMATTCSNNNFNYDNNNPSSNSQDATTISYHRNMAFNNNDDNDVDCDHDPKQFSMVNHQLQGQQQQQQPQENNINIDLQNDDYDSTTDSLSPILLAWKNLRYEVDEWNFQQNSKKQQQNNVKIWFPRKQRKIILHRLNGSVRANSLNGLLGPSGAGKTSLIKCLIGNISKSDLSTDSEIFLNKSLLNNYEKTTSSSLVGFVPQLVHETIFGQFTVEEIFNYAFYFKNSCQNHSKSKEHIKKIFKNLMLNERILKSKFKNCSGGEQRRIAIAQELMSINQKPSFLFVDEPTTGLDSEAALLVMQCLRRLSRQQEQQQINPSMMMTIIVSIHAPSSDILNLFDQLFIMAKGGLCIYSDKPLRMRWHLKNVLNIKLDDDCPPIEEYLRIASNGIHDEQVQRLAKDTLEQVYRRDFQQPKIATATITTTNNLNEMEISELQYIPDGCIPRRSKKFKIADLYIQLLRFFHLIFIVDCWKFFGIMFINSIFISSVAIVSNSDMILPTGCYPREDFMISLNQSELSSFLPAALNRTCPEELNEGLLTGTYLLYQTILVILNICTSLGFSAILLVDLLKVFRNEHQNGWYSLGTFFWSSQLVHLVQMSAFALNATIISYLTAGYIIIDQNQFNWNRFGHFLFFNWLLMIYIQSYGQVCGTIFMDNIQILTIFSQLIFANLNVLNGLTVTLEVMNKPMMVILSNLVGVRHLVEGLLYSFYGLDRCDSQKEYSLVLKKYFINESKIYWNIIPSLINTIILRLIIFLLMYWIFGFRHQNHSGKNDRTKKNKKVLLINSSKPIGIEFKSNTEDEIEMTVTKNNNNNVNDDHDHRKTPQQSTNNDILNDNSSFLHKRYMIGWRSLSLFANSSIYETRPAPESMNSLSSESSKQPRMILKNLNGQLQFGTINALMGTSGSGKTSLLKVLNGRMKTKLTDCTKFYLSKYVPIKTCFITQEISGHLLPGLTAYQSLIYASRLKNCIYQKYQSSSSPTKIMKIDHDQIARKLLNELDLNDTIETLIQNCSDGQRKRLALAQELTSIHMPNLICIDEPTSGLDSNSSRLVIECLQRLVHKKHKNITIVASIHQPNTELLMLFDQCYVLSRDGLCIYSGLPDQIKSYLNRLEDEQQLQLQQQQSISRFPIETLIRYSCTGQENLFLQKLIKETTEKILISDEKLFKDTVLILDGVAYNRNRFSMESLIILCQRYGLYLIRNQWREWLIFIFIYMAIGLSLICFFDQSIAEPSGCINIEEDFLTQCTNKSDEAILGEILIINNVNYISYTSVVFCLALSMQTMFTFNNELKYFFNEHRNGWYSCGVFYLQKFIYETIPLIPIVMIYVYIVDIYEPYTPNNFYWWQVLILILSSMSFQAIAHFVSLITNGIFILMILVLAFFISGFLTLSNLFNPIERLPYLLQLLSNFSIFKFINQTGFWLIYGGERCPPQYLQTILYQLMIPNTKEYFYFGIMMLFILVIFYNMLALLVLILKTNPKSNRRGRIERIEKHRIEKLLKYPLDNNIPTNATNNNANDDILDGNMDRFMAWP